MRGVFADTTYFIAILEPGDDYYHTALEFPEKDAGLLLTTSAVILELGAYYSHATHHPSFMAIVDSLNRSRSEVIHVTEALQKRGIERFANRPDKNWSLTDCISFIVMEDQRVIEAATSDEHFEQAGFIALLRKSRRA